MLGDQFPSASVQLFFSLLYFSLDLISPSVRAGPKAGQGEPWPAQVIKILPTSATTHFPLDLRTAVRHAFHCLELSAHTATLWLYQVADPRWDICCLPRHSPNTFPSHPRGPWVLQ